MKRSYDSDRDAIARRFLGWEIVGRAFGSVWVLRDPAGKTWTWSTRKEELHSADLDEDPVREGEET